MGVRLQVSKLENPGLSLLRGNEHLRNEDYEVSDLKSSGFEKMSAYKTNRSILRFVLMMERTRRT